MQRSGVLPHLSEVFLIAFFLLRLIRHQAPYRLCGGAGLRDVLVSELGVTLGYLDSAVRLIFRVTKNLHKLVDQKP